MGSQDHYEFQFSGDIRIVSSVDYLKHNYRLGVLVLQIGIFQNGTKQPMRCNLLLYFDLGGMIRPAR